MKLTNIIEFGSDNKLPDFTASHHWKDSRYSLKFYYVTTDCLGLGFGGNKWENDARAEGCDALGGDFMVSFSTQM